MERVKNGKKILYYILYREIEKLYIIYYRDFFPSNIF